MNEYLNKSQYKLTEEMKKEIISKDEEVTYYYDRYQIFKKNYMQDL